MVELERDLGLYATITISIGAMVGSGIFVLPGIAFDIAGNAVVLAYLLAGVLVLPAALSKAEIATAIPESGGTYLYIDRAMGPLPGTIAGLGAWLSLVFKSAFALVGLSSYLLLFVELSGGVVTGVAVGIAVLLVGVNIVGVEQTGRLQAGIVTLVLGVLILFIADGITYVNRDAFHPFLSEGAGGVFAATGFVFVSYAGVTKIASVAEEVENPGRNIPAGMLVSIVAMMLVYTFVVFVIVGVAPPDQLVKTKTPMALAAEQFFGPGAVVVGVVAILALTSMANAGVLSSSRFPLAMSRDDLAPDSLAVVSDRFKTPMNAILFTGVVLVALIIFLPIKQLAKFASAFQIFVFALVNAALIAFRESDLEWYRPSFTAPGYPWVQLFGIVGGLGLLTQIGLVPLAGAFGIVVVGIVWYQVYGRERTEREGAALDAIRRTTGDYSLESIEARLSDRGSSDVLVSAGPETAVGREGTLLAVARTVVGRSSDGTMTVARFEEVPDQVTLTRASETEAERETELLEDQHSTPVTVKTIVSHDSEEALANFARNNGVDLVVGDWEPRHFRASMLGTDVDWFMEHVPADLVFVRDRGFDDPAEIVVIADQGPYEPLQVLVADAVAAAHGARLRFLYALDADASDEQFDSVTEYHERLVAATRADSEFAILRAENRGDALYRAAANADVAVVATSAHHLLYDVVFGTLPDRLAEELSCTVLLTHSHRGRSHTVLRYLLERLVF